MSEPIIRYATAQDLFRFYGSPQVLSMRAIVAELDGEIVGVAGVYRMAAFLWAFSDLAPGIRPHRKAIRRTVERFRELLRDCAAPVLATPSEEEPNAAAFLGRVGFVQTEFEGVYQWRA